MKICKATVLFAGVCLFVSRVIAAPGLVPTPATQNTLNAHAGLRAMVQGERLTALYGVPLADRDELEYGGPANTRAFVDAFVANHGDALGVDNVSLYYKDEITIRNGEMRVYRYEQKIESEGLFVHEGIVRLVVLLGSPDKIVYSGFRLTPHPASALPGDVLTATRLSPWCSNRKRTGT